MFKSISFDVQFKHPRKGCSGHVKDSHNFNKGLTLIHGPNESGKSLRAEFLRFALWGSKALRSNLNDYKSLKVEVDFILNDKEYKVCRTKNGATLYEGSSQPSAEGTSVVNARIEKLFVYDRQVFDLANMVLQGEVEALGKMQPAQRKFLVDKLLGFWRIDEVIKDFIARRKDKKIALATLKETLTEPIPPDLEVSLSDQEIADFPAFKKAHKRAEAIDNELKGLDLHMPSQPSKTYNEDLAHRYHLIPVASSKRILSTGLTLEEIQEAHREAYKYSVCEEIDCPKCGYKFHPTGLKKPRYTSEECTALQKQQQGYEQAEQRRKFLGEYSEDDFKQAYEAKQEYIQKKIAYEAAGERRKVKAKLDAEQALLERYAGDILEYEKKYNESLTARQLLRQYHAYKKVYDAQEEQVTTLEDEIDNLDKAIVGAKDLKIQIKSYFVPQLNKAAAVYLSQMTDGGRSSVVITENFDITIDGQPLEALSGSTKAVANLAIRLALGQTLTNTVFSVLVGDEIDAAMDQERSEYTMQCLRNLTGRVGQIIIISHKKLKADHYVELT